MRVFLTGATGFIGSEIVKELRAAGHDVVGLCRNEASAKALTAAGGTPLKGDIEDLEILKSGAAGADAVIHTAFNHDDFSRFLESCQVDRRAIEAMGTTLAGSDRPFVVTSGVGMGSMAGEKASEHHFNAGSLNPRVASELAVNALLERGVNVSVVRLSQVHDTRKQGLITPFIALAREKGVAAYVGDGKTCWSAVHLSDASHLFRLALDKREAGARYHAVAEEEITLRDIAAVIGKGLNIPVKSVPVDESAAHFGWLNIFVNHSMSGSSAITQKKLGWQPEGPGLISDLERMDYRRNAGLPG